MLLPLSLLGGVTLGTASPHATPPPLSNPPTFPPSVSLFTPASDPTLIQDTVNSAYSSNGKAGVGRLGTMEWEMMKRRDDKCMSIVHSLAPHILASL